MSIQVPEVLRSPIHVPEKLLMGPGPSNTHPRVLRAMALPTLGHLHPEFCKIMDDVKEGIKYAFQTKNDLTFALSATGHAAMEAVMANILEAGDVVLIAENGIWGQRAADMVTRHNRDGSIVIEKLKKPAGVAFELKEIEEALDKYKPVLFFITHGETSTGVLQDLEGIGQLCRSRDVLFAVDTVATLGGVAFKADDLGIDVVYSGSQKVLGVPPGLAPISFNDRALAKMKGRRSPVVSYYLDAILLGEYWNCFSGKNRIYHHTGPVNAIYGLREGLAILAEEGLEKSWERHRLCAKQLHEGLEKLGLEFFVPNPKHRLPTVTTVKVPKGLDWKAVTLHAMKTHMVEISGGLGPTAGKVWRIGIMGNNATPEKVEKVLKALEDSISSSSSSS